MTKAFKFNWRIQVPKELQEGCLTDRWTEDGDLEQQCLVKVDDCGFFIYWKSDSREGDVLELSQVNDIRSGKEPGDARINGALRSKFGDSVDIPDQMLTVCSGLDMVNITTCHFVFPDKETCEIWRNGLRSLTNNVKINNVCPMTNLEKHWKRLRMTTTLDGNVSVRAVAKTFASGKTEKLVYQKLAEYDLPSGKTDSIPWESFTFQKFYQIYKNICPRTDIDKLFESVLSRYGRKVIKTDPQTMRSEYSNDVIPSKGFIEFLNNFQRDPRLNEILYPHYNLQRVKEIIATYEPEEQNIKDDCISKEGLTNYLMSDENAPVFLDRLEIYQDMDQPLPHYYINSSHNTYLTGRQFGGKSSVEIYRQVLLAGCRCVELDCWDGRPPDNEPIITHGRAMCTEISFKDVIYAIRDCAFVTSDYPLILSFENHCNRQQQYKMAKYCDEIFGDLLLKEPLPDFPVIPGHPLPSPNRLKRKILIKNKRLRADVEQQELELFRQGQLFIEEETVDDPAATDIAGSTAGATASTTTTKTTTSTNSPAAANATSATNPTAQSQDLSSAAHPPAGPTKSIDSMGTTGSSTSSSTKEDKNSSDKSNNSSEKEKSAVAGSAAASSTANGATPSSATSTTSPATALTGIATVTHTTYQGSTLNVHPYLSSMVVYTQPMKFQGFDFSDSENLSCKMSSFPETTALGYLKTQAIEFVNYNKRQLSRIYPRGSRVDSSNFMPQIFWNSGCQLVSLNFQTPDLPMQLNQGKFEYNQNCGYLLKPDFMRRNDKQFDPFAETPVDGVIAAHCTVEVISGQFLSDKKVGTYVEVDMYGLPTDTIRKEFRTKVIPANGLNPVYNEEPFVFRKVVLPELAVLRFAVYDDNNKMLGQRILPFEDLQAGYRHIALRTEGNFPMSLPMLFCNIQLKVYIPEGLSDFMEALSDPRAYLSQQEQRAEKLRKSYGISDADISTENVIMSHHHGSKMPGQNSHMKGHMKKIEEQNEIKFEALTPDFLKKDKSFLKLSKKQAKELEAMRKRHGKERVLVQKTQCAAIEKLRKTKGKDSNSSSVHSGNANEMAANDPALKSVVVEQTKQWSDMMERHRKEEWETMKQHLAVQTDLLKKLMENSQAQQMKDLLAQFEKENKELKITQARASVDSAREIQSDKNLKSKAEKDRRIREKNSNNTKLFIDQRKTAMKRQEKRKEKLKKTHENQVHELNKYTTTSMEMYKNEEIEYKLSAKPECFV